MNTLPNPSSTDASAVASSASDAAPSPSSRSIASGASGPSLTPRANPFTAATTPSAPASNTPAAAPSTADTPPNVLAPFASDQDRRDFQVLQNAATPPVPEARQVAREMIQKNLGIDGDQYHIAHFKDADSRRQGQPDQTMTLTQAVMQAFPGTATHGAGTAVMDTLGGLMGGGNSPTPAGVVSELAHSQNIGDFFQTAGRFLWSRTGPGYVVNTFFSDGNMPETVKQDLRSLDQAFGLYPTNGQGFAEANQAALTPSQLVGKFQGSALHELPYVHALNSKMDAYWDNAKSDWPTVARYQFVTQARQARADGSLTQAQYETVMKGGAPKVPLDGPVTLAQLRQSAPPDPTVKVERFDINGYPATNIVRFKGADPSEVMYVPGNTPSPFVTSRSWGERGQWVVDQGKDPDKQRQLLAHFSALDRQEGVMPYTDGVAPTLQQLGAGKLEANSSHINRHDAPIGTDVFEDMRAQTQARMRSDASTATRNAWEGWRDTLDRAAVMFGPLGAPLQLGTGVDKAMNGTTPEERKEGRTQVADSAAAMGAMKAQGEGRAADAPVVASAKPPKGPPTAAHPDPSSGGVGGLSGSSHARRYLPYPPQLYPSPPAPPRASPLASASGLDEHGLPPLPPSPPPPLPYELPVGVDANEHPYAGTGATGPSTSTAPTVSQPAGGSAAPPAAPQAGPSAPSASVPAPGPSAMSQPGPASRVAGPSGASQAAGAAATVPLSRPLEQAISYPFGSKRVLYKGVSYGYPSHIDQQDRVAITTMSGNSHQNIEARHRVTEQVLSNAGYTVVGYGEELTPSRRSFSIVSGDGLYFAVRYTSAQLAPEIDFRPLRHPLTPEEVQHADIPDGQARQATVQAQAAGHLQEVATAMLYTPRWKPEGGVRTLGGCPNELTLNVECSGHLTGDGAAVSTLQTGSLSKTRQRTRYAWLAIQPSPICARRTCASSAEPALISISVSTALNASVSECASTHGESCSASRISWTTPCARSSSMYESSSRVSGLPIAAG